MNQATRDFICLHADDDVQQLALSAPRKADGVDMAFALRQIAGRQVARRKLPSWAAVEGLVYPPHISMEQCSSEQTARYKATLVHRLLADNARQTVVDLTGGLGVDFSFLAPMFRRAIYVERQEHLCEAARENFRLLGLPQAEVVCGDGTDYLRQMLPVSLIYIDPARRDANGQRTFGIADCTPDVTQICDEMVQKSEYVLIKLSPMLDWHEACASLMHGTQCAVREVHIVSVGNECKELLLVTENGELRTESGELRMVCVNILADEAEERFELNVPSSQAQTSPLSVLNSQLSTLNSQLSVFRSQLSPLRLYVPNASIMKAGCFAELSARYGVEAVGQDSHLFVSDHFIADFPGRKFQIEQVTSLNKRDVKAALQGISQANIAVRNFPLSVAELRKRLRLKDGGDCYIFGTTVGKKSHLLLICRKIT